MVEISMKQINIKNAFRLLDDIGELSDEEVAELFTQENVDYLVILSKAILGINFNGEQITSLEFAQEVSELRKKKKNLARKLGDTIILADEKFNEEGAESSIRILQRFIDDNTSPFFREHALNQIEYYKRNNDNTQRHK